jgi:hypothetical protein
MSAAPIKDGGPAFPMQEPQSIHAVAAAAIQGIEDTDERDRAYISARAAAVGGMSLRDYFAAKVLPNIYSTAMVEAADGSGLFSDPDWRMGLALDAYAMADAMLKAREA